MTPRLPSGRANQDGARVSPLPRLAVVEDNSLVRSLIADALTRQGFDVVLSTGSAKEALLKLPLAEPDVVLLDVHLPDGNGLEIASRLSQEAPRLRFVILTDYLVPVEDLSANGHLNWSYVLKSRVADEQSLAGVVLASTGGAVVDPVAFQGLPGSRVQLLSAQQRQVLEHVAAGSSNTSVAEACHMSVKAVEATLTTIYRTLDLRSSDGEVHQRVTAARAYWSDRHIREGRRG